MNTNRVPSSLVEKTSSGDCLECRIIGTTVCLGVSAYMTASVYVHPPFSPIHRAVTLAFAGGFAALGIARAFI